MATNSKTINFRLGNLTTQFLEQCKIENLSTSELVRKALLQYFRQPEKSESKVSFSVENKHDYGEKKKVVVTFTETEFQALEQLKKFALKPTYQAVIIAIFRAYISEEPYLNEQEILLLKDANTQLLAIGRNLNQIARKINSGEFKTELDSQYLEQLIRACQNHENYFRGLINRATLRRKIKVEI
ncbi:plasmid mobilization relaxosome protein MobC [Neisseria meningitidis]|nr:plasmid mobilization relaxosome protein MobC [Neisseria meningitidis]